LLRLTVSRTDAVGLHLEISPHRRCSLAAPKQLIPHNTAPGDINIL